MSEPQASPVDAAESYYDSGDADAFYRQIWGEDDTHIGLYEGEEDPIPEASRRTEERMAAMVDGLGEKTRVIDLGAGYGGAARFLAETHGCSVLCVNVSEKQNSRNRMRCLERGLDDRVTVRHGSFEDVPAPDGAFDLVWSQDAFLHGSDRARILEEAFRVLAPGGQLVFTDPMQSDDCPPGVLQPVYDRIHLESLGSFRFYREAAAAAGFEEVRCVDLTEHLRAHYDRVRRELRRHYHAMVRRASREYVDRMLEGLSHWVEAADAGHLAWGILHFRKP